MKIVLAPGLYPPDIGGPATFAKQLAEFLGVQEAEVVVVPFGTVRHLPPILRHLVYFWKVYAGAQGARYVIALDPVSVGLPALLASKARRTPLILRVGGDYAWEQGVQRFNVTESLDAFSIKDKRGYAFGVRVLCAIQSFVARHAKTVVVPSEYLKSIVATWNVPQQNILRIYSSAQTGELPSREEARQKFGLGPEPVILTAGRFVPWKGFPALIDAVELLQKDMPNVRLFIAGSGPDAAALKAHASKLGEAVRFVGDMPKAELMSLVRASDVFVLNTNYEGLSHQLIEVMQAGVPIVTTNIGGNRELIEDGVSGRLVVFNDTAALSGAMQSALTDSSTVHMTAKAQEVGLSFSAQQSMARWGELVGVGEDLRVLMLSGDANALNPQSDVYQRLLLQAGKVGRLDVFVYSKQQEVLLGEHGAVHGFGGSKFSAALAMLRAGSRLGSVDVVTTQDPFFLGLLGWRIARRKNAALQLQVHTNITAPAFKAQHRIASLLARFLLGRAQSVRVVSAEIESGLRREAISAAITVLPIFVDEAAIQTAPVIDLHSQFPQFMKFIVVAARLEKEKRIDEILVAMRDIVKLVPGVGLLIAGNGSEYTHLQEQTHALGLGSSVVFLGRRQDVYSLYKSADLVIAATAAYEGFGATAVEALAAGAPVVATRDAGVAGEAGAEITAGSHLAEAAGRVLQSGNRGKLLLHLPTAQVWAQHWRESVGPVRVKP